MKRFDISIIKDSPIHCSTHYFWEIYLSKGNVYDIMLVKRFDKI